MSEKFLLPEKEVGELRWLEESLGKELHTLLSLFHEHGPFGNVSNCKAFIHRLQRLATLVAMEAALRAVAAKDE